MSIKQVFIGFVAIAFGCGVGPEDDEYELVELEQEDAILEIVENLRLAGNPESEIEVRADGTVVLGGDAVVSLEASREMIGAAGDEDFEFRQYRTTNFLAPTVDTICVNGAAITGDFSTALDDAIANYTDLNLSFDLIRTNGEAAGCDATITASMIDGLTSSAGFPSGGLPFGSISIGDDTITSFSLPVATHVITHELGHCIGLRHTDYYNRSISCNGAASNEGDAGLGAIHIPGTPATAVANGSVMNSCYNAGNTGQWAADDVTALNAMYSTQQAPMAPGALSQMSDNCYGLHRAYWEAQPNATSYQLWRSTSSSFTSPVQIYSGSRINATVNVSAGTWYLRARACNATGCSDWTNDVSATRVNYCM